MYERRCKVAKAIVNKCEIALFRPDCGSRRNCEDSWPEGLKDEKLPAGLS